MLQNFLADLHLWLTPDDAHKAVFTNVPIIGFKNKGTEFFGNFKQK